VGSLTKEELVEVVNRIYASWNQTVPAANSRTVYNAWWRVLGDLTVVDVDQAVDTLIIDDSYMPRPGAVRRLVIERLTQAPPPPAPLEAWQQLRAMSESAHNGSFAPTDLHPCFAAALRKLGGPAALGLHTNGDRDAFCQIYEKVVLDWEREQFGIGTPGSQGV
jgi:hypothetical protein